jgi:hypothetical protein
VIVASPFACRKQPGRWKYRLVADLVLRFPGKDFGCHQLADEEGRIWLYLHGCEVTILEEYSWDGASLAPDWALMESCLHDALCQFLCVACYPLRKKECDALFYDAMKHNRFCLSGVYHGAVRIFGGIYSALTGRRRCGKCLTKH